MLSPQPDRRQLAVILNDPILLQHVINARLQGEIEALNRVDSRLPPTDRGTQAHRETLIKLCDYLQPMDFVHEIVENQVRLISPPDAKGNRFRLLTCRGDVSGTHAIVNRKGNQTQILVEQENPLHFPHLPLYDIEKSPPLNIWCIASVD